nr:MAG TPA: hypothetical protein [Caudoviricetes sp.]DAK26011.1 MAG TPA: hypothetical protein [Caudoviricetes sp.]DAZ27359.1 MAG TPA: hypothetical protein [Caudoviricetes sp.]
MRSISGNNKNRPRCYQHRGRYRANFPYLPQ